MTQHARERNPTSLSGESEVSSDCHQNAGLGGWNGGPAPNPPETIAEVIDEWVNAEVLNERGVPALSRRLGSQPQTEQSKHGCRGLSFSPRRKQAKVAHRVIVTIGDMLRKHGNKLHWSAADFQQGLRSGVFDPVNHLLLRCMENALLGNRKSPDVTPGVPQEMLLCHPSGNVDVPSAICLLKDQIGEILRHR